MEIRIKKLLLTCLLWMVCIWRVSAGEVWLPDELQNIYARSAVVIDGSSGRVLFGKNAEEVMPMASTTKIMTCILALESSEPDEIAEVSENAARQPEVHLGAGVGETFYLKDLLYALMLESYNDAAVIIAEHVSGSVENFTKEMNQKARELGCEKTHFVTPNGLDGKDEGGEHTTTAAELAKIMRYCAWESEKSEAFLRITQTRSYMFSNLEGTRTYSCYNHNAFLEMYEGTISGKTGFTSAAGYCYVTAVESEGRKFAGVVLACGWPYNRTYKWKDMTRLMDYAKTHYYETDLEYPDKTYLIEVENGWIEGEDPWKKIWIPMQIEEQKVSKVLIGEHEKLIRHIEYKKTIKAPVQKNMVLGKIQFFLNGELWKEASFLAQYSVEHRKISDWLVWTLQKFCL